MIRQNPYYIQDNIRLDLRDSQGRYASPQKAKSYKIYVDSKLVRVGEFSKVSLSVEDKEFIITEDINEIYTLGYDQPKKPKENKRALKRERKEFEEKLAEEMLEDLVNILAEEQQDIPRPKPPKKPKKVKEEKIEEEIEEDLSDLLYTELLDYLYENEPLTFEEVTGKELKPKGKTYKRDHTYKTYKINGEVRKGEANVETFTFKLNDPINLSSRKPQDLIDVVSSHLMPAMKKSFERRQKGKNFFFITLIYSQVLETKKGIVEEEKGMSMGRFEASNWEDFKMFIEDPDIGLFATINKNYVKYLELSFNNTITTVGFKLEHIYEYL